MARRETVATVIGRFVGGGLFEPRKQDDDKDPRHSACIVLEPGQDKSIDAIVQKAIEAKWGSKKPAGLQLWGVREGDDPEFEASFEQKFINPKANKKPQTLYKKDNVFVECTPEDDLLYAGAYVAVSVEAYGYDGDKKKNIKPGVTLNLRAVMFRKHGERLGDHVNAEDEFGDLDSELDDDLDFLAA